MSRRALGSVLAAALVTTVLTTGPPATAALPDDNGRIAFIHQGDLWTIDPDGAGGTPIAADPMRGHGWPAWSPDGTTLAFTRFGFSEPFPGEDIFVMAADGTGLTNLTGTPGRAERQAAWSPDRSKIAFASWQLGTTDETDIWVMNADGTGRVNITNRPAVAERTPAWSPDGTKIAFCAETPGTFADIWVMNPDGTGRTNLTNNPGAFDCSPSWSPDGGKLAFASNRDIWVMNADGTGRTNLGATPAIEADPAWSPDGTQLAFILDVATGEADQNALAVMAADGTDRRTIFTFAPGGAIGEFDNSQPSWQPLPGVHRVGLVDPDQGLWRLREQGVVTTFFYGNPGDTPFLGDWDCDGVATPGLYRTSDGFVYLRNSATAGIADVRFFFGDPGDVPLAGDFNGDGCDTVSLYRPSEGRVYVINRLGSADAGLGAADFAYFFGNVGDQPFAGDFDGDGVDTVGLHRASTGLVYFRNTNTTGIADVSFVFGDPGDRFVGGDWTQDGVETAGLFRPGVTKFFFRNSNTAGIADASFVWGEPDWLPVAR